MIDSWQPDVVIASDDNASKYLIAPYYKGGDLPFVFCGLNWDASVYGFPAKNVTGMVEVAQIPQLLEVLKRHAKGDRESYRHRQHPEQNPHRVARIVSSIPSHSLSSNNPEFRW